MPAPTATPTLAGVQHEAAKALMRTWWDRVWGQGDLDALDALLTDPYVRHTSAGSEAITPAAYKAKLVQFQRVVHGAVTTVDDEVIHGDKVWTRATSRGVNLDTGDLTVITWMVIHRIEGSRIAESWIAALRGVDWER
jgi:ketosteroid isomerase-like protein